MIGNDSLIGHGIVDLSKLKIGHHPSMQEPVIIFYDNKPAGKILLEMQIINPSNLQENIQVPNLMNQQVMNANWKGDMNMNAKVAAVNNFGRNSNILQNESLQGKASISEINQNLEE